MKGGNMWKIIKFVITIIIIIWFINLITSCSKSKTYYVALGDSVGSGFGLDSHEESYPAVFFNLLKNEEHVNNFVNMSIDGFTTTMLLDYLNNIDAEGKRIFENTKVISLNIGGNNVIAPFKNYISNLQIASGADNISSGLESFISGTANLLTGVTAGIRKILSNSGERCTEASTSVVSGINDIKTGIESIGTGTSEIIEGFPNAFSMFNGSFSPALENDLEKGIKTFSVEFLDIIAWLKENSPHATIIVNTVYNPFPQQVLGASVEFSITVDRLIQAMNSIIIQESKRGYFVVDAYTYLSDLKMMQFNLNPSAGNRLSLDVIHPNTEGHQLIAQLNYEAFTQQIKNRKECLFFVKVFQFFRK
jgi:lysophospholipase L1-like esterase